MDTNVKSVAEAVWWLVLLRGIFMVIFGLVVLVSPGIALLTLVWVFGFYALLDGISAVVIGIRTGVSRTGAGRSSRVSSRYSRASSRWSGPVSRRSRCCSWSRSGRSCWGSARLPVRSRPAGVDRMPGAGRWLPVC